MRMGSFFSFFSFFLLTRLWTLPSFASSIVFIVLLYVGLREFLFNKIFGVNIYRPAKASASNWAASFKCCRLLPVAGEADTPRPT